MGLEVGRGSERDDGWVDAMAMSVAEAGGGAQADLWSGGRWSKGEYLESTGGEDCEGRT